MTSPSRELFSPERVTFFSDGIFAIALTVLVIELKVPESGSPGELLGALGALWPRLTSFVISFLLISVVWFNHHAMFHHIRKADRRLILLNMLLLFNIIGMPFISELLGQYIAVPGPDALVATLTYGAWVAWGGVPFNLLWRHAAGRPELHADHSTPEARKALSRYFLWGPGLYTLATLAAFLSVWASLAGFALLILIYFLPPLKTKSRRTSHG